MTRARPYDRQIAVQAAMSLFWDKGFHATSIKDLENALQMKPGSIYAAFKSKEALYLEALDFYGQAFQTRLAAIAEAAPSPLAALAGFLRVQAAEMIDSSEAAQEGHKACMVVKTMLDQPLAEGPIGQAARRQYEDTRAAFAALFRQAQAEGQLPPTADPEALAQRYQMDLTSLRIEAQRTPDDPVIAELAEDQAKAIEALAI